MLNVTQSIDQFLHRHLAFLSFGVIGAGLLVGDAVVFMAPAIPWCFTILTFNSGLGLRIRELACIHDKPWILPLHLVLLHFALPLVVWSIGSLFFDPETVMGFVLFAMMPTSVSSIMWVGLLGGNLTMITALILIDTFFAPFIIPYALQLFSDASVILDPVNMLQGIFWMLLFPTVLALILNRLSHGGVQRIFGHSLSLMSKMMMLVILFINGSVTSPFFLNINLSFIILTCMVLFLSSLLFVITFFLGDIIFSSNEDIIAFMLGTSMRSLTMGMVLAIAYFTPLATFIVLLAMLFQQPQGAFAGKMAQRFLKWRMELHKAGTSKF
jgi:predicted Na+-dependent transporter